MSSKTQPRRSVWVAYRSKARGVIGYMECFATRDGRKVTIPGVSRWIAGPVLDESRARLIGD